MAELSDLTTEVANRARDAAYVAVGLGVLGFQRAQVQRHQLKARFAGELDLDERLAEVRSAVTTGVQQLDELFEGAVQAVETSLQPIEEQLPAAARELAQRVYDQARDVGVQLRQLVNRAS